MRIATSPAPGLFFSFVLMSAVVHSQLSQPNYGTSDQQAQIARIPIGDQYNSPSYASHSSSIVDQSQGCKCCCQTSQSVHACEDGRLIYNGQSSFPKCDCSTTKCGQILSGCHGFRPNQPIPSYQGNPSAPCLQQTHQYPSNNNNGQYSNSQFYQNQVQYSQVGALPCGNTGHGLNFCTYVYSTATQFSYFGCIFTVALANAIIGV